MAPDLRSHIVFTGSRRADKGLAKRAIAQAVVLLNHLYEEKATYRQEFLFAVGDAKTGVDATVREMYPDAKVYDADWNRYGKAAGPIRNKAMLTGHRPEWVVAITDRLKDSGTEDCVEQANALAIPVLTLPLAHWYHPNGF